MKAALFENFGEPLKISHVPDPQLPEDGVIIQVKATGICRSDWHGWMGHDGDIKRLPHVPGHEWAGCIVAAGKRVHRFQPGQRVTAPFAIGCGGCAECLAGNQHICDEYFQPGFTAWGSFAELAAIPHADVNLVTIPEACDYVESASLGCRFITAFRAVVAQGRLAPGEWLVVHGCGGVGLAAVMIGQAMGAQVLAVDIKEETLALAKSLGASHGLNARNQPLLIETIRDLTQGGAHASLDALGSRETCRNSILSLRKRGRHVQVGLMVADYQDALVPMNLVIARELEILGSHGMPAHHYGPLFAMIQAGKLQPRRLVQKTIGLEQAPAELQALGTFAALGVTVIDHF